MRVALYKESLEVGLEISMLLVMLDLLRWYNLYPGQLVPNTWRAIVGFFSLMVHHCMEPRTRVF